MPTTSPRPTPFPVRSIELATGVRLDYVEQGDAEGTPMVMLHGLSDSWRSYEPLLPHLPSSIHAFAITQRGHGDSDRPDAGYAVDDLAADVIAFMDAVGLPSAIVVGHSMGTIVAQRVAIDHPRRVSGLLLLAGAPSYAGLIDELGAYLAEMTDPVDAGFVIDFQESTLAQPVPRALLETAVSESLKMPARVWRALWEGTLLADHSDELGRIAAPTLLVYGEGEQYVPRADQAALAAAIPGARSIVYADLGHAPHWERPDLVATDVAFAGQLQSVT